MDTITNKKIIGLVLGLFLAAGLLLGGCTNIRPIDPQSPPTIPAGQESGTKEIRVTYNYSATDKVQLSNNNIVLKVGQKLILEPAPGLTKNTRFMSSGEYFFSDVMDSDNIQPESGKLIFVAKKPGKGKLQIIPNYSETNRAVDLWVTVQ